MNNKIILYKNDIKFIRNTNYDYEYNDEETEKIFEEGDNIKQRILESEQNDNLYIDYQNMEIKEIPKIKENYYSMIKYLFLDNNNLTEINLNEFKNLTVLNISKNKIKELIIPLNLKELFCNDNLLEKINANHIEILHCNNNNLKEIKGEYIKNMECANNKLIKIENFKLKNLICNNNPIELLEKLQELEYVECSYTKIKKIKNCDNIQKLYINNTPIEEIDVFNNIRILSIINTKIIKIPYMHTLEQLNLNNEKIIISTKYENYTIENINDIIYVYFNNKKK